MSIDQKSLDQAGVIAPLQQIIHQYTTPNLVYHVHLKVSSSESVEFSQTLGIFRSLNDAIIRALGVVNVDLHAVDDSEDEDGSWQTDKRNHYDSSTRRWTLVNPEKFRSNLRRVLTNRVTMKVLSLDPPSNNSGWHASYRLENGLFQLDASSSLFRNDRLDHIEPYKAWIDTIDKLLGGPNGVHSCAKDGHVLIYTNFSRCRVCHQSHTHSYATFCSKTLAQVPIIQMNMNAIARRQGLFGFTWIDLTSAHTTYLAHWTDEDLELLSEIHLLDL